VILHFLFDASLGLLGVGRLVRCLNVNSSGGLSLGVIRAGKQEHCRDHCPSLGMRVDAAIYRVLQPKGQLLSQNADFHRGCE